MLKKIACEPSGGSNCKVTEKKRFYNALFSAGLIKAMGIVSVDRIEPRHLFFANSIFNFIIRDYGTLGSPFLVTTLWITIPY